MNGALHLRTLRLESCRSAAPSAASMADTFTACPCPLPTHRQCTLKLLTCHAAWRAAVRHGVWHGADRARYRGPARHHRPVPARQSRCVVIFQCLTFDTNTCAVQQELRYAGVCTIVESEHRWYAADWSPHMLPKTDVSASVSECRPAGTPECGTGFVFSPPEANAMLQAVDHAVHLFRCAAHLQRITPRNLMLSQPRPRATMPYAAAGVGCSSAAGAAAAATDPGCMFTSKETLFACRLQRPPRSATQVVHLMRVQERRAGVAGAAAGGHGAGPELGEGGGGVRAALRVGAHGPARPAVVESRDGCGEQLAQEGVMGKGCGGVRAALRVGAHRPLKRLW